MGVERETARLRLRRPRPDDLGAWLTLHADPRTYAHAPASMPTPEEAAGRFDANADHWHEYGFGHLVVEEKASEDVVGVAGVRLMHDERHPHGLNLYYRLAHETLGRGYGREVARAVVASCLEELPDLAVLAVVKPHNHASLATARGAGLVDVGTTVHSEDLPGDPPSVLLAAPRFSSLTGLTGLTGLDDALREEMVDLWKRVNDAGGAVGFRPGAARAEVASRLAQQETALERGLAVAGVLRSPLGPLLGFGFWVRGDWWGHAHVLTLGRLMIDPASQGRGTGRLLMAGMHGLARRQPDVELWRLQYRSGLGIGRFYAGLGWVETGRQPLGLRLADDDRRDDVSMARLPDGGPLVFDGRG